MLYLLKESSEEKKKALEANILSEEPLDLVGIVGKEEYEASVQRALDYAISLIHQCIATAQELPNEKYRKALCSVCEYMEGLFVELKGN